MSAKEKYEKLEKERDGAIRLINMMSTIAVEKEEDEKTKEKEDVCPTHGKRCHIMRGAISPDTWKEYWCSGKISNKSHLTYPHIIREEDEK